MMTARCLARALALSLSTFTCLAWASAAAEPRPPGRQTTVSIRGEDFWINGRPTYAGRAWEGHRIEGLLLNARLVQGVFDDLNPETAKRWAYPDTKAWDPDRNTNEFVAAMPDWRKHGLLAFTLNLQGGSPEGYSKQPPMMLQNAPVGAFSKRGRTDPVDDA